MIKKKDPSHHTARSKFTGISSFAAGFNQTLHLGNIYLSASVAVRGAFLTTAYSLVNWKFPNQIPNLSDTVWPMWTAGSGPTKNSRGCVPSEVTTLRFLHGIHNRRGLVVWNLSSDTFIESNERRSRFRSSYVFTGPLTSHTDIFHIPKYRTPYLPSSIPAFHSSLPPFSPLTPILTISPGTMSTQLSPNTMLSSSASRATPLTGTSAVISTTSPLAVTVAESCFGFCKCAYLSGSGQLT